MSTMYAIDKYEFHNRKPSKKQIESCFNNAMSNGTKAFDIIWGENVLEFTFNKAMSQWFGNGWIKDLSGQDLAEGWNNKQTNKTLNLWNT